MTQRMPTPSFTVLPRRFAIAYAFDEPFAVISIGDPDQPMPWFVPNQNRRDVLRIEVMDLEAPFPEGITFGREHARQVLDFVQEQQAQGVSKFVIHCEAGISRSRGCALGLSLILGSDPTEHIEQGMANPLVVHHLLEEHRCRTGETIAMPKVPRPVPYCESHPGGRFDGNPLKEDGWCCSTCKEPVKFKTEDVFARWIDEHARFIAAGRGGR